MDFTSDAINLMTVTVFAMGFIFFASFLGQMLRGLVEMITDVWE